MSALQRIALKPLAYECLEHLIDGQHRHEQMSDVLDRGREHPCALGVGEGWPHRCDPLTVLPIYLLFSADVLGSFEQAVLIAVMRLQTGAR